jgi:hypothetical protein
MIDIRDISGRNCHSHQPDDKLVDIQRHESPVVIDDGETQFGDDHVNCDNQGGKGLKFVN